MNVAPMFLRVGAIAVLVSIGVACASTSSGTSSPTGTSCAETVNGSCSLPDVCFEYAEPKQGSAEKTCAGFKGTWTNAPCAMTNVVKGCDEGCDLANDTRTFAWYRTSYPQPTVYAKCTLDPRK